jgi:hypothetical protein
MTYLLKLVLSNLTPLIPLSFFHSPFPYQGKETGG